MLEAHGIVKTFAGVAALREVSLSLAAGTVHALIGENGAGKSTLINVLTGVFAPDAGSVRWQPDAARAQALRLHSPQDATRHGIAVIHQEPQLIAAMSALDNLFLGERFPTVRGTPFVSRESMRRRAAACLDSLGIELPLASAVADLSATQRTLLALARCTLRDPRLLILDEPTAALTSHDAQRVLAVVSQLRARGKAVLYVSHRLDEVLQIADRITVLRNGATVAVMDAAGQDHESLVDVMAGREAGSVGGVLSARERPGAAARIAGQARSAMQARTTHAGRWVASADDVSAASATGHPLAVDARLVCTARSPLLQLRQVADAAGRVKDVSLEVQAGEIVGIYGLAGAGRTELLEMGVGLRRLASGTLRLLQGAAAGEDRPPANPNEAARRGVVLIPEDRRGHALVLSMRVRENLTLSFLRRFACGGWINARGEREHAQRWMADLGIKAASPEQTTAELSGGNQQKVVFARALAMRPSLLLCDEPTQAVDVGTRRAIHQLLRTHCTQGGGALVVTSDIDEMLQLADRIVVLREGRSVATLVNAGLRSDEVLRWCFVDEAADEPVASEVRLNGF